MMQVVHGFSKGVIGRDMYSDNTLRHMTKSELIELLKIAQNNYESVLEFYGRAVEHSEKLLKHGHWTDDNIAYVCSLCGKSLVIEQGDADMNYCPDCGARMDGDKR